MWSVHKFFIYAANAPTTHDRGHIAIGVVIAGITAMVAVIAFVLFKKSGHRLPIPKTLISFANPLFVSKSDVADNSMLIKEAEEENPKHFT